MRTRTFLLSLGLVLLLVLTSAVAAIARQDGPNDGNDGNGDNGNGNGNGGTELTLYSEEDTFTYITADGTVDPGEETEPSAGDRFVVVDTLFSDEDRTDEVGRNDIECTFTDITGDNEDDSEDALSGQVLCHGVVTLDDQGSLAWQASAEVTEETDGDEPFVTVALTGGTGDFTAAGGEADIFDTTGDDGETVTGRYEITLLDLGD